MNNIVIVRWPVLVFNPNRLNEKANIWPINLLPFTVDGDGGNVLDNKVATVDNALVVFKVELLDDVSLHTTTVPSNEEKTIW